MREILGWNGSGDSILAPGGSISNMYALMIARNTLFIIIWTVIANRPLFVYDVFFN